MKNLVFTLSKVTTFITLMVSTTAWSSPVTNLLDCLIKNPSEIASVQDFLRAKSINYQNMADAARYRWSGEETPRAIVSASYGWVVQQFNSNAKDPESYSTAFSKWVKSQDRATLCSTLVDILWDISENQDDMDKAETKFGYAESAKVLSSYQPNACKTEFKLFLND